MPIYTFPTALQLPLSSEWQLKSVSQNFVSPFDGSVQTIVLPGGYWRCTVSWATLNEAKWRALDAFLALLEGQGGRFYFGPPHARTPRGTPTGTPLVQGANQVGSQLVTDGWTASTAILKAGDYFHVDVGSSRSLHVITSDVSSNGSGVATLSFKPPLRASPADNAAIVTSSPSCVMQLDSDEEGSIAYRQAGLASASLAMREALT